VPVFFKVAKSAQIHNVCQLKSADVCYESEQFLPPRKKLTDSNTFLIEMIFFKYSIIKIDLIKKKMQKKCRFENKLVKPENWTGQEFTFSSTVHVSQTIFRKKVCQLEKNGIQEV
jgi:hypothetical protein